MHRPQNVGRKLLHHLNAAAHFLEGGAKLIGTARVIYEGGRALAPLGCCPNLSSSLNNALHTKNKRTRVATREARGWSGLESEWSRPTYGG